MLRKRVTERSASRACTVHPRVLKNCILLKPMLGAPVVEREQVADRNAAIKNLTSNEHIEGNRKLKLAISSN